MAKLLDDDSCSIQEPVQNFTLVQKQVEAIRALGCIVANDAISHVQKQVDAITVSYPMGHIDTIRASPYIVADAAISHIQKRVGAVSYIAANAAMSHIIKLTSIPWSMDDPEVLNNYLRQLQFELKNAPHTHEILEHPETHLLLPEGRERLISCSPSISLLEKLRASYMSLDDLHWRQLEELIADLLSKDGYEVTLGPGSKDGGKDLIAIKYLPGSGLFMSVWQAKKLKQGNKVGLRVIRELADTRQEHKASKGVIVTTTSLTRDALKRIDQDRYLLHKVDGNDLDSWIRTGRQP